MGIYYIQIFENEWVSKSNIVKSIIRNKLKINDTIYARNCSLKEISYNDANNFLSTNHIQGSTVSKVNIGLFSKNKLYAVGTFGKYRFNKTGYKQNEWELLRFCNIINFTVVGGFQKILSYFEKTYTPKKIISFVDIRYFNGFGYLQCKFLIDKITSPDYFYFKNNKNKYNLLHRINFQKHKLKNKLDSFDSTKTEYENMISNGYLRIFDAGNLKMIKTLTSP